VLGGEKIRVGRQGQDQVICIAFCFHFAFTFWILLQRGANGAFVKCLQQRGGVCNLNLIPELIDVTVQRTDYFAISGHPWMDLAFYAF
jgi:hypothetical protein